MKKTHYSFILLVMALASCSKQVYNNKNYISTHVLDGKKIAVLPAEVFTTGIPPSKGNIHDGEENLSINAQKALEQAYLVHASNHQIGKTQQRVTLIPADRVNQALYNIEPDIRNTWAIAPDSLGRALNADLVLKIHIVKTRFMSEVLASGINTGTAVFDAIINTTTNKWSSTPRMKAYEMNYQIDLIDVRTGQVVSSTTNKPVKDQNGNSIDKTNRNMAEQSAVYFNN